MIAQVRCVEFVLRVDRQFGSVNRLISEMPDRIGVRTDLNHPVIEIRVMIRARA